MLIRSLNVRFSLFENILYYCRNMNTYLKGGCSYPFTKRHLYMAVQHNHSPTPQKIVDNFFPLLPSSQVNWVCYITQQKINFQLVIVVYYADQRFFSNGHTHFFYRFLFYAETYVRHFIPKNCLMQCNLFLQLISEFVKTQFGHLNYELVCWDSETNKWTLQFWQNLNKCHLNQTHKILTCQLMSKSRFKFQLLI